MESKEAETKTLCGGGLSDYFQQRVQRAVDVLGAQLDEHTQAYVVNLLASFATRDALVTDDEDDLLEQPIAMQMIKAMRADPGRRFRLLQQVGDVSLYLSGYFSEAVDRGAVDRRYYMDMGAGAYRRAAGAIAGAADNPFRRLFHGLSVRFVDLVHVLDEVSQHGRKQDVDILRLYDRWRATGSDRLAQRLATLGVHVPAQPSETH